MRLLFLMYPHPSRKCTTPLQRRNRKGSQTRLLPLDNFFFVKYSYAYVLLEKLEDKLPQA
jgi:hypothetical protein